MDWLNDHAWAAWLGLAAMFGVAEMFSLDLIFLMLAVGAMGGVVAGAFDAPLALQVLVALGTSLATLTLLRPPLVARLHGGPDLRLGTGKLIGTQGVVTAQITRPPPLAPDRSRRSRDRPPVRPHEGAPWVSRS